MNKQQVIDLLRAAGTDPDAKRKAERALARFVLDVASAEAKAWGLSKQEAMEGANRVLARLQTYIPAKGITDPEHIVNLAAHFIRGGYVQDKSGAPVRNQSGTLKWRPGIFSLMTREWLRYWSKNDSLSQPISPGADQGDGGKTVADTIAEPDHVSVEVVEDMKPRIRHWIEELAREAEVPTLDGAGRATLNALILHIKGCVAPPQGTWSSATPDKLCMVLIDTLLKDADLRGFDAWLFDKTESQWTMRRDVWQFLAEIMGPYIRTRKTRENEAPDFSYIKLQNAIRQRVNRVLPILYKISIRCGSDVLGVGGICQHHNIRPASESVNDVFYFVPYCENVMPYDIRSADGNACEGEAR